MLPEPKNGLGLTALILGLVGLLFGTVPLTGFIAVGLGITGLALGLAGLGRIRHRRATNKKTTITGVIASAAAVAVGIWGITIVFGAFDQLDKDLSSLGTSDTSDTSATSDEPTTDEADAAPVDKAATTAGKAAASSPKVGSRDKPVPAGTAAHVGTWDVTVHSTNVDAARAVLATNQFNEKPAAGRQFVMATVTTTYTGAKSGTPWADLSFHFAGAKGNTFGTGDNDNCGVIPNDLSDAGELFSNAKAKANVCVSVPGDQISGGTWMVEESFALSDDSRVFMTAN